MIYEIMRQQHLKSVMDLQQEWAAENITYGVVAGTMEQICEEMTPYCFIAREEETIIGYLMAQVHVDNEACIFPKGSTVLEINDLFISKEYRSRGVGKALLHLCERKAEEDGILYFLLSSATKDAQAVRSFYTRNQYTVWTTTFFKKVEREESAF